MSELVDDPEARLDFLVDRGVLEELDHGSIVRTDAFQADLEVYEDSYLDVPREEFVETVASVFDLDPELATERIEETGTTRQELATFLALRSFLDDPERTRDELALMAAVVAEVEPDSPVPGTMPEVGDDTYGDFVADNGDVVLFVFQRNCAPCDVMKEDLPEIVDAAPARVSFAGVDGDEALAFRREYEVTVAPTTLLFVNGELDRLVESRQSPESLADEFEDVYGPARSAE